MTPPVPPPELADLARRTMLDAGFEPDIPPDALQEAQQEAPAAGPAQDLRSLLWSSIDNGDSRDLDQVEFAEKLPDGAIRVRVGIADVDALAPRGSAIDAHAGRNTTTVYAGPVVFPMLPEELAFRKTSLLPAEDRSAVVVEMVVDAVGKIQSSEVYAAVLTNRAKLDYESAGAWLEGRGAMPAAVLGTPGLESQLRLQDEAAERLHGERLRSGALDFETIEARPVMHDGRVVDLALVHKNRARTLIENFMVAANAAIASFLAAHGVAGIQRVVRSPERWPRIVEIAAALGESLPADPDSRALAAFLARRRAADPDHFPDLSLSIVKLLGHGAYAVAQGPAIEAGHFGLAVPHYTHSTAPNRRYPDLLVQRLVKAVIARAPAPYSVEELQRLCDHCTERERAAQKVERKMRKLAAAALFGRYIGRIFDAIVTGVTPSGVFVRTLAPPVEGRVLRGESGMDVGDRVRVRLIATDTQKGFIDFERAG